MPAKRTEPSQSLLQGGKYTNSVSTDLAKRFAAMRRAQAKAERGVKAEVAQQEMDLSSGRPTCLATAAARQAASPGLFQLAVSN